MSPKRILVIDDEEDIRDIAQLAFESSGDYQVISAGSGSEGLAAAQRERPDVVLLDVMMPGLDGPSTLRVLRASSETAAIPVIFLTAKVQPADKRELLTLGARGIIEKPFDPLRLPESVMEVLS